MLKFVIITVLLSATLISAQLDPYEVCLDQEDGIMIGIGAEETCTGYFYCEGEIGYEEDCAVVSGPEFQFNYETGQCDYDDVVLCEAGGGGVDPDYPVEPETDPPGTLPPNTPPPQTQPPVTPPVDPSVPDIECPTDRPGQILFFASSNCSEYFICSNGVRMRMSCMEGFTWNDVENQCDYPIFSRCSSNIVDDGMNVRCTRDGFYSTAYPRDCTRFVFCSLGIAMIQNCPMGFAWQTDRCVERQYASCPDMRRRLF